MKDIWHRFEAFAEQLSVDPLLNEGCPVEALDDFEKRLSVPLGEQFRELYCLHDGQKDNGVGLIYEFRILPLEEVIDQWSSWSEIAAGEMDDDFEKCLSGRRIKPVYANRLWVPIIHDHGGNHLGIDLDPDVEGRVGQVINFGRDENEKYVIADGLRDFFLWLLELYDNGNYRLAVEGDGTRYIHTKVPPKEHALDAFPAILGIRT